MNRKFLIPVLFFGIVFSVVLGFVLARPLTSAKASGSPLVDLAAANPQAVLGTYYWSFAAKFVCGYQSPTLVSGGPVPGEPVVKPGNYATEINIQNPNFRIVPLIKRVIVLVNGDAIHSEPNSVGPTGSAAIELPGNFATLDDCNTLWILTHPQTPVLPTPMPVFIGYLVILSPLDLNVNAVYTADASGVAGQTPTSASIDVLTVAGKRVFLPGSVKP